MRGRVQERGIFPLKEALVPRRERPSPKVLLAMSLGALGTALRVTSSDRSAGYRASLGWRALDRASQTIDRRVGWHRVATPLGLLVLIGVRNTLRKRNLYDTDA